MIANRNSIFFSRFIAAASCFATLTLLPGCGSGASVAGVEGTGSQQGDVSGFSSVIVNGAAIDSSNAEIIINGQQATEAELSVGDIVVISTNGNGAASRIVADRTLDGPLESVDFAAGTATALSQNIRITATSRLINTGFTEQDSSDRGPLNPANNDLIAVSGYIDADGVLVATRFQRNAASYDRSSTQFDLIGPVSNLSSANQSFNINNLTVNFASANVNGQLANGVAVKVVGQQPDLNGALNASTVQVRQPMAASVGDAIGLAGFVTEVSSERRFTVAGNTVDASTAERLDNSSEPLARNSFVRTVGIIGNNGDIVANQFAIMPNSDVSYTATASINGDLQLFTRAVVADRFTIYQDLSAAELRTFSRESINDSEKIRLAGYYDQNNQLTATVIERLPTTISDAVSGLVSTCNAVTNELVIAQIDISVTAATEYFARDGSALTGGLAEFCTVGADGNAVATGTESGNSLNAETVQIRR